MKNAPMEFKYESPYLFRVVTDFLQYSFMEGEIYEFAHHKRLKAGRSGIIGEHYSLDGYFWVHYPRMEKPRGGLKKKSRITVSKKEFERIIKFSDPKNLWLKIK